MPTIELLAEIELLKARAERAERELAALKKDARICAECTIYRSCSTETGDAAARRILEATKEGTDADH